MIDQDSGSELLIRIDERTKTFLEKLENQTTEIRILEKKVVELEDRFNSLTNRAAGAGAILVFLGSIGTFIVEKIFYKFFV